jgi:PPOX class probable FMN-dependent enzyme
MCGLTGSCISVARCQTKGDMSELKRPDAQYDITELPGLERLFDAVKDASILKEIDHVDDNYAAWIAASPFFVLATLGAGGLDCSPRGDAPGFVRLLDPKTLLIPDRRGNNRIDSLRNVQDDPRVALLFLIPGQGETLRVNGRCRLNTDPELCAQLAVQGKAPKVVLVVSVETVFFQCSRALVRSGLWDAAAQAAPRSLPTPGKILADISQQKVGGEAYDRELPERVKATLY